MVTSPILAEAAETFSATVVRHFALWPFGTRTLRLFLLVDPSRMDAALLRGLLRAMQQAFVRCETGSQTNAVRAAARAAHFVLQHHNYDLLAQDHTTAAAAVAALKGGTAYVALVGDAAAFAWRGGLLTGQRTGARLARPLGLEGEPRMLLWSSPLVPGDRLILVCGGSWSAEAPEQMRDVLRANPSDVAEQRLAEVLAGPYGLARVLVYGHGERPRHGEHELPRQVEVRRVTRSGASGRRVANAPGGRLGTLRRWLAPVFPLLLVAAAGLAILSPPGQPQHLALAQQAEALLGEAHQSRDVYRAHALAITARDVAQRAASAAPAQHGSLVDAATRVLHEIDRVQFVQPVQVVRLGPTGINVVDLAVGTNALYTLDVVEAAVRRFALDAVDQQPVPETLLIRRGTMLGNRVLDTPVAIRFVADAASSTGALTIVDQARAVVQVMPDGAIAARALPSSATWQRLGALGAGADGNMYVVDSGARYLLEYASAAQRLADPPRPLFSTAPPDLRWEHVAEVLAERDIYVRLDDGTTRRFDPHGRELGFDIRPPDGRLTTVAALAPDRAGGLYLADLAGARIIHVTADGRFVRQLRDPALGGVRQLHSSLDGQRLFALVASGVLAFDVPADVPAPVPNHELDASEEPAAQPPK